MKQAAAGDAFWRIVESLIAENERTGSGAAGRQAGRATAFWRAAEHNPRSRNRKTAKPSDFLDALSEDKPDLREETPLPEIRAEDIARELGIRDAHDLADLGRIRKAFASANHPDRCQGAKRQWAEERMKLANAIIDSEIARRRGRAPRRFRT